MSDKNFNNPAQMIGGINQHIQVYFNGGFRLEPILVVWLKVFNGEMNCPIKNRVISISIKNCLFPNMCKALNANYKRSLNPKTRSQAARCYHNSRFFRDPTLRGVTPLVCFYFTAATRYRNSCSCKVQFAMSNTPLCTICTIIGVPM